MIEQRPLTRQLLSLAADLSPMGRGTDFPTWFLHLSPAGEGQAAQWEVADV